MNLTTIRRKLDELERRPPPEPAAPIPDDILAMKLAAVCHAARRPEASVHQRNIVERIGTIARRCAARMTGLDLV